MNVIVAGWSALLSSGLSARPAVLPTRPSSRRPSFRTIVAASSGTASHAQTNNSVDHCHDFCQMRPDRLMRCSLDDATTPLARNPGGVRRPMFAGASRGMRGFRPVILGPRSSLRSIVFVRVGESTKWTNPRKTAGIDTTPASPHNWEDSENWPPVAHDVISRTVLTILVTVGCVLPLAIVVTVGVGRLLAAMEDAAAARVLDRVALAIGLLWAVDLLCLLLALGIHALGPPSGRDGTGS